jgi:hypothetical protein
MVLVAQFVVTVFKLFFLNLGVSLIDFNGANDMHNIENNDKEDQKVSLNINSEVTFARNDIQEHNENGSTNGKPTLLFYSFRT